MNKEARDKPTKEKTFSNQITIKNEMRRGRKGKGRGKQKPLEGGLRGSTTPAFVK